MSAATSVFPNLPLLERVKTRFYNRPNALRNVGMVCLQHLVETTGSLLEEFLRLGLRPEHTFVLGKIYSTNPSVECRLRELGFRVFSSTHPRSWGSYENHLQVEIEEMWSQATSVFRASSVEQIVVLDDGGSVLASIPRSSRLSLPVTGVEQTMSGVSLQEAGQVHVPVVQVATSAVKKLLEPSLIQEAVFVRVSQRELDQKISYGVVGLGSIGTAILSALSNRDSTVHVFDKKGYAVGDGLLQGVVRCSNLEELFRDSDCIFGCTGTDILEGSNWWKELSGSRVLISCSSHDREFRTVLRSLNGISECPINKLADIPVHTDHGQWLILRGGFPVNFDGSIESVPESNIQLTRALLMGGVLAAIERGTEMGERYRPLMLDPNLQKFVVEQWLDLVPQKRAHYAKDLLEVFTASENIARHSAGEWPGVLRNQSADSALLSDGSGRSLERFCQPRHG